MAITPRIFKDAFQAAGPACQVVRIAGRGDSPRPTGDGVEEERRLSGVIDSGPGGYHDSVMESDSTPSRVRRRP